MEQHKEHLVCMFSKSIYGLKNKPLNTGIIIVTYGFIVNNVNQCTSSHVGLL